MRLSLDWLSDYGLSAEPEALAQRLTMAGLEVDAIEAVAPSFNKVVVGEVLTLEAHPDADKLRVATVNVGEEVPLQIVCGAPNVFAGARVPTALIGALLPGEFKIKRSKLRGVESQGMLCSARELGISEDHDGLLILPEDAPVGQCVREYLRLNDVVLDIDLTPNRADAFSVRGLAREISVLLGQKPTVVKPFPLPSVKASPLAVRVEARASCPIYHARVIEGVDMRAPTPLWLRERLRRAGVRPHDAVVDVTNYVMLMLGTPMHAFDKAAVSGDIVVRDGKDGETLTLLDGTKTTLDAEVLVIADADKALAIAGVMGGEDSACSAQTTDIILESAWFEPLRVAGKARRFGVVSDAAQRFERGVDYTLQLEAMAMATQMIVQICGGRICEVATAVDEDFPLVRAGIDFQPESVAKLIGKDYDKVTINNILSTLGCQVIEADEGWRVIPPSWRFDMTIGEDLIEEVARIDGYDNVPEVLPQIDYKSQMQNDHLRRYWTNKLVALGFQEAITYSFIDHEAHAAFFPDAPVVALSNPISANLAEMRLSLLPGLVRTAHYNRNHQQGDLRLFETGKVFLPQGTHAIDCVQQDRIAGVMCGLNEPEQWAQTARKVDFFDVKAVAETLLDDTAEVRFVISDKPYLHPGQSADIYIAEQWVGAVGALHPSLQKSLGIKGNPIWVFELIIEHLNQSHTPSFAPLSKYPSVRRDLALVVDENISAASLETAIIECLGTSLSKLFWFDLYQGSTLKQGKKSLAVALLLKGEEKTLQDEEVERMISRLVEKLTVTFGVELR